MYLLNRTASVIWACFDGTGTVAEIAADLAEVFGIGAAEAEGSVLDLAIDLGRSGLLEGVAGGPMIPTPAAGPGDPQQP